MRKRYKKQPKFFLSAFRTARYGSVFVNAVMLASATALTIMVIYGFDLFIDSMPHKVAQNDSLTNLVDMVRLGVVGFTGLTILLPMAFGWIARGLRKMKDKRLMEQYKSGGSTSSVGWYDFERLCKGLLEKNGYKVEHKGGSGGDGGIDLIAHRGGVSTLVQCKHWKSKRVGVSIVREMVGAAIHHGYPEMMVITSGTFTREAVDFAEGKKITLIDGHLLRKTISVY